MDRANGRIDWNPLMKALELKNATFCYGERIIFSGFNFALEVGDKMALVGPNGCGKSTLLHLLVGLHSLSSGQLVAFDRPCTSASDLRQLRRRVGLVFQDVEDQLFCPTVLEEIAFGPLNLGMSHAMARQVAEEWLERMALTSLAGRITYHLSGGEKRRVALASVLAMSPDVLLLDEPTAGLDQKHWVQLVDLLKELPQSLLIASHDPSLIRELKPKVYNLGDLSREL